MVDAVVGVLVEYTIKPILHQLDYLFHYNENIKEVGKKIETLGTTRDTVQILVSQDRGKGNAIFDGVTKWLDNVKEVLDMVQQNEASNSSCFNCVQRHQLSRKAKKMVENIVELINEGRQFNKDNVGYPLPSPETSSSTLPADYQIFESRTSLTKRIMDALANPNVNKVGVCGMGGVGKTAMLNEVKKLVLENNLFDRVIKVEVGQSKSVNKIQEEIRDKLNMELNMECQEVRASRLQTHIVERKENILFMLDDLWKEYDVEKEFGIPCRSESRTDGCKILMTGRRRDLFANQKRTEKLFEVNSLTKEESWRFFVAIVGDEFVEDEYIQQIGKDVVKECGGLPIALKILAKVLKGKRVEIWEDALKKLKNPIVVDIHGVSNQLYSCLRFSYNSIEDEAKLVLLLCSVFPDDHRIRVEDLQIYAMGMRLLNHINTWEDARNRVIKLVDDLKSSYLLLVPDELGDAYVQMHDVVHDFAKFVAYSEMHKMSSLTYGIGQKEWEEDDKHGSYNAVFIDCTKFLNLPSKLEFPNLQLFISRKTSRSPNHIELQETFFEGMEELRVLDLRDMGFTPSIHSLKNLRALCLAGTKCHDIDIISKLKKLEILRIRSCEMEEFPASMSELIQLKVLQVAYCSNLKVIHPNIISNMTRLEELSFSMSFKRWGEEVLYKNKLIKNVRLSELNCLTRLIYLKLHVINVDMFSNELSLEIAQKLKTFRISVGVSPLSYNFIMDDRYARSLEFYIHSPIDSIDGVLQILSRKCEALVLEDSMGFTKLLCNTDGNSYGRDIQHNFDLQVAFSQLKYLLIRRGDNFESLLWQNNALTQNYFCKLEEINISRCNKLTCVFPSCIVTSLVFLTSLQIHHCELVERIFEIDQESSTGDIVDQVVVPLTILELSSLPNLKHVWNNDPAHKLLTFPNLKNVKVEKCPQLKTLFPASFINHMKEIEELVYNEENEIFGEADEASKLVSSQVVLFPSLRSLTIQFCKVVKKKSSLVRSVEYSFPKLEELYLIGSDSKDEDMVSFPLDMSKLVWRLITQFKFEMVQVLQNGEDQSNLYNHASSRGGAKLKALGLDNLPNLTHVGEDNTEQMTSSCFDKNLEYIGVRRCENLKCLLRSSITFFNLTSLAVEDCNGMMNLFNSSVIKSLMNLRIMDIRKCKEMKYIVVAQEGGEANQGEEIVFNKLLELRIHELPSLTSFHSGKCMLKFPCLEMLDINGCLEMKTFSYGITSMPKLPNVEIEKGKVSVWTSRFDLFNGDMCNVM